MSASPMKKRTSHSNRLKDALEEKRLRSGDCTFSLALIRAGVTTPDHLRDALDLHGVVVIRDAFTPEAFAEARAALREAYRVDVEPQLKAEDRPAADADVLEIAKHKKHWPAGIIGNKSFGYLFAQPEASADTPRVRIGDANIAVQPCSAYKANLKLLEHESSQLTLATLLTVTNNKNGMVSQDSSKFHRETLTKPHVDIYGTEETRIQRVQAMAIGPGEGTVRLCFARFTHLPEIQKLIEDAIEKDKFYQGTGFLGIPDDHREALLATLKEAGVLHAGAPGELIIWRSGVIHVEMQKTERDGLVYRADNSTTVERYIVGTHQPYNLSQVQLLKIGCLADQGFLFGSYNKLNKDNAAGANSVHLKTTQFKHNRVRSQDEKDRLEAAERLIHNGRERQQWLEAQNPRKLHCLGITQPADQLFTDPVAKQIFLNH